MAKKERQGGKKRDEREKMAQAGEVGGFTQEAKSAQGKAPQRQGEPKPARRPVATEREAEKMRKEEERLQDHYTGRTLGDTATSYTSVGGADEPEEWAQRVPEPDDNAPDYETPGGYQPDEPEATTGPVHDISFRPAPGGMIETPGHRGRNIPYTGEVVSTRDSTFEEDPDTGRTASEEEGEFVTESLEERTRGYESG